MGWDLKGIIGSAIAGAADAGGKYFVEERRKETELAAQKELADYRNEIEINRQQRLQEMKDAKAERDLMSNRESNATNEELANDFAKEQGHKPGTVGWYEAKADFLDRSGREDLAKNAYTQADKIRADDTKDQIAAARAAARAGGGGGGGGGGSSEGKLDIEKSIETIGEKYGVGYDTEKNKAEKDASATAHALELFEHAKRNGASDDKALAYARGTMAEASRLAVSNQIGLGESLQKVRSARRSAEVNARIQKAGESDEIMPDQQFVSAKSLGNTAAPKPGIIANAPAPNANPIPEGMSYVPAEPVNLNWITPGRNPRQAR